MIFLGLVGSAVLDACLQSSQVINTGLIECFLPLSFYKPQTLVRPYNRVRFPRHSKPKFKACKMPTGETFYQTFVDDLGTSETCIQNS